MMQEKYLTKFHVDLRLKEKQTLRKLGMEETVFNSIKNIFKIPSR